MAGQASGDFMTQTVDGFASKIQEYANGIAQRLGTPMSGVQLSKDETVQRWNYTPLPSAGAADAQYHSLIAQGVPPGQALNQVYPMRQLLIQGSDLNDSIDKAKQIATWAADAAGIKPPPPFEGSTIHVALAQQNATGVPPSAAAPAPVAPPMPLPGPVAPPPMALPPAPTGLPAMGAGAASPSPVPIGVI